MENFRDFEAGPDPFGRMWQVQFKFLQTAISIRHSDSVDVRYVLHSGDEHAQKTVVIAHPDIRAYSARTGRKITDAWCSRIAKLKIVNAIETAEDLEKDFLSVSPSEIEQFDQQIRKWEDDWPGKHAA